LIYYLCLGAVSENSNFQSPTRIQLQERISESLRVIKQKNRNDLFREKNNNLENIGRRRHLENEADNLYNNLE